MSLVTLYIGGVVSFGIFFVILGIKSSSLKANQALDQRNSPSFDTDHLLG